MMRPFAIFVASVVAALVAAWAAWLGFANYGREFAPREWDRT